MDDALIHEALRSDEPPPPAPFFRFDVMRRIRAGIETPPLAFPWRILAIAVLLGAIAGGFVHLPSFAFTASEIAAMSAGGALVAAFALGMVSDSV